MVLGRIKHITYIVHFFFYYYYIISTSDHQALDLGAWGPLRKRISVNHKRLGDMSQCNPPEPRENDWFLEPRKVTISVPLPFREVSC